MPATVQKTHFSISALTVRVSSLPEKNLPTLRLPIGALLEILVCQKVLMALIQVNFYDGDCF